ncbi:MAG: hypothetical protein ACO20H_12710 [Bacteriovoracaceae bacterium]
MSGFLEKFSFFNKKELKNTHNGPELHLQRMKRIQKLLGNITVKELKVVEDKFESLGHKFGYPLWEVSRLFEWLYKNLSIQTTDTLYLQLEKSIKTAKTLGRSNLNLKKTDLEGVVSF